MHNIELQPLPESNGPSDGMVASQARPSLAILVWECIGSALRRYLLAISSCFNKIAQMIWPTASDELSYLPKRDKIVEGALLLLERAEEGGQALTATQLATTMFLADKAHLDAFGRPVFFDNYVATKNGPEGVAAMEMLDTSYNWALIESESVPWTCQNKNGLAYPRPLRSANMRRLSETDVEALESALGMVLNLHLDQLSLFTHRCEAYVAAWDEGRGEGSRLDPRLIPDTRDDEMIDDLLYASRHAFIAARR